MVQLDYVKTNKKTKKTKDKETSSSHGKYNHTDKRWDTQGNDIQKMMEIFVNHSFNNKNYSNATDWLDTLFFLDIYLFTLFWYRHTYIVPKNLSEMVWLMNFFFTYYYDYYLVWTFDVICYEIISWCSSTVTTHLGEATTNGL